MSDVTEETGGRRGGRRGGGRAGRQAARTASVATKPYLERTMPPVEMLSEEGLAAIEENAEEILATVGVAFQEFPEALDLWRQAGARVEGEMVYFPKGMCREIVEKNAPTSYIQHARNHERSVKIGENTTVFAPNYGSPFGFDLDNGRRYGTIEDFGYRCNDRFWNYKS